MPATRRPRVGAGTVGCITVHPEMGQFGQYQGVGHHCPHKCSTPRREVRRHESHITHGQMGRELWRRLADAGFEDRVAESVIAHSTIFAVADAVIGLREAVDEGVHDGLIDRGAGDRWLDGLRAADKNGRFFAALTGFVVAGRTP